jgi:hypothetical protein
VFSLLKQIRGGESFSMTLVPQRSIHYVYTRLIPVARKILFNGSKTDRRYPQGERESPSMFPAKVYLDKECRCHRFLVKEFVGICFPTPIVHVPALDEGDQAASPFLRFRPG